MKAEEKVQVVQLLIWKLYCIVLKICVFHGNLDTIVSILIVETQMQS